jgi:hypothetical protein
LLSQKEVGVILKLSERAIRAIERRAIEKLRNHPALKEIWREWQGRGIEEAHVPDWHLSRAEIDALYHLARTSEERRVLRKLMALIASSPKSTM